MDMRKNRQNSTTQIIIKKLGLEEVEKTWQRLGMYKSSIELSSRTNMYVSPYVLRYMSYKYNWKRYVNKQSPLYKGYLAGNVDPSYYKHLIFNENTQNEREYNH
jgi:hypothetical protein